MSKEYLKERLKVFLLVLLYIFGFTLLNWIDIKLGKARQSRKNQKKIVEHVEGLCPSTSSNTRYSNKKSRRRLRKR